MKGYRPNRKNEELKQVKNLLYQLLLWVFAHKNWKKMKMYILMFKLYKKVYTTLNTQIQAKIKQIPILKKDLIIGKNSYP